MADGYNSGYYAQAGNDATYRAQTDLAASTSRAVVSSARPAATTTSADPADAARMALLVVDDDDDASAPVIPGRQFRRLFTQLASTGALA